MTREGKQETLLCNKDLRPWNAATCYSKKLKTSLLRLEVFLFSPRDGSLRTPRKGYIHVNDAQMEDRARGHLLPSYKLFWC